MLINYAQIEIASPDTQPYLDVRGWLCYFNLLPTLRVGGPLKWPFVDVCPVIETNLVYDSGHRTGEVEKLT